MVVIWEPMYPGDARDQIDTTLFDDARVTSFWDPQEISGRWFGDHRLGGLRESSGTPTTPSGPRRAGSSCPNRLVATGAPIIGGVDALQRDSIPRLGES